VKWFRRLFQKEPQRPAIPPHRPVPLDIPVSRSSHARPDPGIEVREVDTSSMTTTGVHRAWDRMKGGG
jgi:hypothetical protein